jgi:EAL domain-containing protein (putative c-di-GMP-specific phosphodiesterase class I)
MLKEIVAKSKMRGALRNRMFQHLYQPLCELKGDRVIGYEALIRCPASPNPEILFQIATKANQLFELDTMSMRFAARTFGSSPQPRDTQLFLNVFPSTMLNPLFPSFIESFLLDNQLLNDRIVFEIVESEEISDIGSLQQIVGLLRSRNFRIAIDDVGKGKSSLERILELEPDFIKLDRYLAANVAQSVNKQDLISLFVEYCKGDTRLVLEGIETAEDWAMTRQLGVHIGQGYFIGKASNIHGGIVSESIS